MQMSVRGKKSIVLSTLGACYENANDERERERERETMTMTMFLLNSGHLPSLKGVTKFYACLNLDNPHLVEAHIHEHFLSLTHIHIHTNTHSLSERESFCSVKYLMSKNFGIIACKHVTVCYKKPGSSGYNSE